MFLIAVTLALCNWQIEGLVLVLRLLGEKEFVMIMTILFRYQSEYECVRS